MRAGRFGLGLGLAWPGLTSVSELVSGLAGLWLWWWCALPWPSWAMKQWPAIHWRFQV